MGYFTLNTPPTWAPNAYASNKGWVDPDTGEVIVAIRNLANRRTGGGTATRGTFTTTNSKTKLKTGDVITLTARFNEAVTVDSAADGVSSLTISNGGSNYTTPPTIGFSGGSGTGAAATAVMGVHDTVTITAGGTGYSGTPTVSITGGGGTGATGTVAITGDAVSSITITNAGTGYTSVPTFTISGTGTGATATGKLKVVSGTVTASGSGYVTAPTVAFTGGGGSSAAATAVLGGSPYMTVTIGGNTRNASYTGGTGTNSLTFAYTIVSGDSGSWTAIGANITANGATFLDSDGSTSTVITGVGTTFPSTSGYAVDNAAPTAGDVVIYGGAKFTTGAVIKFKVPYSENVTVTGTPLLDFDIDGTARQATYVSTSGGDVFFDYTVVEDDSCTATDFNLTGTIDLDGGTILDQSGNSAPITGLAAESFIDTVFVNTGAAAGAATVSSVSATGTTYGIGDNFDISVQFSQRVGLVTGSPLFNFLINGNAAQATYVSGQGTTTLVFRYTVAEGDAATSGQVTYAANPIDLNGGSIVNSSLTAVNTAKTAATLSSVVFDGVKPTVVSASFSAAEHPAYETDDVLELTVEYSKAITVTGTPKIAIGIGDHVRELAYASGTGTTELVFQYTVVAGDVATIPGQGFFIDNTINVSSSTLEDASGNTAPVLFRRPSKTLMTFNA